MSKRQVFFSFEYEKDNWRASQVRNMGKVDDSSTFSDNDWEEVKCKTDKEIKKWIDSQLAKRSCLVVLIGKTTSTRKWIKYEIEKAYELNKGIVGIYVHNLKDNNGNQTSKGSNPFYNIYVGEKNERLSKYVTCFDSIFSTSTYVYDDIKDNIEDLIEEAIENRDNY
ncbi:TIR domain-containing protein [Intestinibacter sp.]